MPRTLPAGTENFLSKQGGSFVPVLLLDIQTLDGTQYFWSDYEGYYPAKLTFATRVQSAGGTSVLKMFLGVAVPSVNGQQYIVSCQCRNDGLTDVTIAGNIGPGFAIVAPGSSAFVSFVVNGDGVNNLNFRFATANAGDAMDLTMASPVVTFIQGGANLIPGGDLNFAGWSNFSGSVLTLTQGVAAPAQFYNAWIKTGCNFTRTKDMTSNAGDLLLQNISGNTIDRDVALALKNHEFEGAYAVTRLWIPLLDVAIEEFHCSLTEQIPKEDEAGARELQLFDPSQYVLAGDVQVETCTFRFKSAQCGSTGSATSCPKRFVDCQDVTRAAQERFPAILTTVPVTASVPAPQFIPKPPRTGPVGIGSGGGRGPLVPSGF